MVPECARKPERGNTLLSKRVSADIRSPSSASTNRPGARGSGVWGSGRLTPTARFGKQAAQLSQVAAIFESSGTRIAQAEAAGQDTRHKRQGTGQNAVGGVGFSGAA